MICYSEIHADISKKHPCFFLKPLKKLLFLASYFVCWLSDLYVTPEETNYPKHLNTPGSSTPKTYLKHQTSGGMTGCLRLYTPFFVVARKMGNEVSCHRSGSSLLCQVQGIPVGGSMRFLEHSRQTESNKNTCVGSEYIRGICKMFRDFSVKTGWIYPDWRTLIMIESG